jgi:hypothetical protein
MLYFVWYSNFLFGKVYHNITRKINGKSLYFYFFIFLFFLVVSYFIALLEVIMKVTTFWDGVFLGFLIWVGFVLTHEAINLITYKKNWKLFFLDNLLYLLGLMTVAGIIAG